MSRQGRNRQNTYRQDGSRKNLISQNLFLQNAARQKDKESNEILLSISIMMSGREETAEKCIDSLARLRERVPCELILTDTGCSPKLRRCLEEKADKMLTFEWCNDFAAARNAGLLAATGKWFMFMDDDEWFESTSELEQFFLSGEYASYESAHYVVRNYVDYEGSKWADTSIARMVRRRPETRFRYPIHEILFPIPAPSKIMHDYVHHYGYVLTDEKAQKIKTERNLSLLLPALEKDPSCIHYWLQATGEYAYWDRWEEAVSTAEKGILHFDPQREDNANFIQGLYEAVLQLRVRRAFLCQDRELADSVYREAVQKGQEILSAGKLSRLAVICACGDMAIACGALDMQHECSEYTRLYLEGKAYFDNHLDEWTLQQTMFLSNSFELFRYFRVLVWGLYVHILQGRKEEAEVLLKREELDWWVSLLPVWYKEAHEEQRRQWGVALEKMAVESPDSRVGRLFRILIYKGQAVEEAERKAAEDPGNGSLESNGQSVSTLRQPVPPTPEMEALAMQLKDRIRLLMEQGMKADALNTIQQLQAYFPEDEELSRWRQDLS